MDIYLIRHGETPWNKAHRFQGQTDVPLNDYGRELARLTRDGMPPITWDCVFASPLVRAFETAQILLEGQTHPADGTPWSRHIVTDERLKEFGFGPYEGSDISAVAHDSAHPMYDCLWHPERYVPPSGAESFGELVARAGSFVSGTLLPLEASLSGRPDGGHVLVVAHGALIRAMVVVVGQKTVSDFWGTPYYNCCVTRLIVQGGLASVVEEARTYYDPEMAARGWRK